MRSRRTLLAMTRICKRRALRRRRSLTPPTTCPKLIPMRLTFSIELKETVFRVRRFVSVMRSNKSALMFEHEQLMTRLCELLLGLLQALLQVRDVDGARVRLHDKRRRHWSHRTALASMSRSSSLAFSFALLSRSIERLQALVGAPAIDRRQILTQSLLGIVGSREDGRLFWWRVDRLCERRRWRRRRRQCSAIAIATPQHSKDVDVVRL